MRVEAEKVSGLLKYQLAPRVIVYDETGKSKKSGHSPHNLVCGIRVLGNHRTISGMDSVGGRNGGL